MYDNMNEVKYKLIEQHFNQHRPALVMRAKRNLGEYWCEDAVNDAYEACLKYADKLPVEYVHLNNYIYTILNNIVRRYQRDQVSSVEIQEDDWVSGELGKEMQDKGHLEETMEFLAKGYDETQRGILYMYLIQGEKAMDVAIIFNTSVGAIKMLASRFREKLSYEFN